MTHELRQINAFRLYPADADYILRDIMQSGFTAAQLDEKTLKQSM